MVVKMKGLYSAYICISFRGRDLSFVVRQIHDIRNLNLPLDLILIQDINVVLNLQVTSLKTPRYVAIYKGLGLDSLQCLAVSHTLMSLPTEILLTSHMSRQDEVNVSILGCSHLGSDDLPDCLKQLNTIVPGHRTAVTGDTLVSIDQEDCPSNGLELVSESSLLSTGR